MRITKGFGLEIRTSCCFPGCKKTVLAFGIPEVGVSPLGGPVVIRDVHFLDDTWGVVDGAAVCMEHHPKLMGPDQCE